jgi:hypothetical protein
MNSSLPVIVLTDTDNHTFSAEFKNNINITSTNANNLIKQIRYIKYGKIHKKTLNILKQNGGSNKYYKFTTHIPCHLSINENTLNGYITGIDENNNAVINTEHKIHFIKLHNNLKINNNSMYGGTILSITSTDVLPSQTRSSNVFRNTSNTDNSTRNSTVNSSNIFRNTSNTDNSTRNSTVNSSNIFRNTTDTDNSTRNSTVNSSNIFRNTTDTDNSTRNSTVNSSNIFRNTTDTDNSPRNSTVNSSNIFRNTSNTDNSTRNSTVDSSNVSISNNSSLHLLETEINDNSSFDSFINSSDKSIYGMRGGTNLSMKAGFLNMDSNSAKSYFSESSSSAPDYELCD